MRHWMLSSTPIDHLIIVLGIQPAELRRVGATLSLANYATLNLMLNF